MLSRKSLAAVAAAISIAGAGSLAVAGSANAALSPTYQAVADGTSGYYQQTGLTVHDIGAIITPDAAALNIGGVGQGGAGVQGCDPNNGFGFQEGLVSNGTSFSVEYATGVLKGANADNCVGNGVLVDPHILNANLTGLPVGDSVTLYARYSTYKKTNGSKAQGKGQWFGAVTFQAADANGFETYTDTVWKLAVDGNVNMAGAGIQQDTTGMSACTPVLPYSGSPTEPTDVTSDVTYTGGSGACNDVADFSDVFVNGHFGIFGYGPGLTAYGVTHQVITTGGGLKANAAIVAPNDSLAPFSGTGESAFSVYAGQVIG